MNNEDVLLKPGQSIRPVIELNEIEILLENIYGLKCIHIKNLEGYDDRNYHVKVELIDNRNINDVYDDGYVLKILNSLDSEKTSFIEAQNNILLELCKKEISCPTPIPTKTNSYYSLEKLKSGIHVVRLMKYISGEVLHKAPTPDYIFYEIGKFAAKLDEKLTHFHQEAYIHHKSLWMLDSVSELNQFLFAINDPDKYQTISRIIEEFTKKVLKRKNEFERGIIHGDFNEQNILVEKSNERWEVKGILDFGDSQFSCYLFELAILMTYMLILGKRMEIGGICIAGYYSVRKIPMKEIEFLKLCIEARLCQSLVLGAYSSLQDPDNDYILTTAKPGWNLLEKLTSMTNDEVLEIWIETATKYCENVEFIE
ncbi:hydroxylysine kinase [Onthophagus taurus]|uniref:hydroxylysine kinase n=1 Tax=Onthophagus taurus TaxID=166361 RepID=UPI0039BE0B6C